MMIDAEMYGMIPSANTVKREQRAAGKHVEQAQDATLLALKQLLQFVRIDAGHRNVRTEPIDDEREQQEDEPATQVAELAALCQLIRVRGH
jgi:hypothetical protein